MRIVEDKIQNIHYRYDDENIHQIRISNTISSLCLVGEDENGLRQQLTQIQNIGENVQKIDDYCCYKCTNLTNVKSNSQLKYIMDYSFCDCTNLTGFTAVTNGEATLKEIGTCAFGNTKFKTLKLKFSSDGGEKDMTKTSCFVNCSDLESVEILGAPYIKDYMFANCRKLKTVNLPDAYFWQGRYSFMNCTSLKTFTFPSKYVGGIGDGFFKGCSILENANMDTITVAHGGYTAGVGNDAFDGCRSLFEFKTSPLATTFDSFGSNMLRGSYLQKVYFTGVPDSEFQKTDSPWRNGFGLDHDCKFFSKEGTEWNFQWRTGIVINSDYPNFLVDNFLYQENLFPVGGSVWLEQDDATFNTWFDRISNQAKNNNIPIIILFSGGELCEPCKKFKRVCYGPNKTEVNEYFNEKKFILMYVDESSISGGKARQKIKELINPSSITPPSLGMFWQDKQNVQHVDFVYIPSNIMAIEQQTPGRFIEYIDDKLESWGYNS